MKYVYHMVPADFRGATLYSLTHLQTVHPDLHEAARRRYAGREHLLEQPVPGLGARSTDVVHCAPVHPARIFAALVATGHRPRARRWFRIPLDRLRPHSVVWYRYVRPAPRAADFAPFDPARYAELGGLPAGTLEYYAACARAGRLALMFHLVPHVLVAGPVDVAGVERVEWSAAPPPPPPPVGSADRHGPTPE